MMLVFNGSIAVIMKGYKLLLVRTLGYISNHNK